MKILLPCLPEDKRGGFAVFIRLQELLFTIESVRHMGNVIKMSSPPEGEELLDMVLPYCDPSWESQLQQMKETMRQMDQMKDVMEMAMMMSEMQATGTQSKEEDHGTLDEG